MIRSDVPQQALVISLAKQLQTAKELEPPVWAQFVKTGVSRQRPPTQDDWWHTRAASVLRKVGDLGPIGTEKLRRKYGGRQNRGYKPEAFKTGSANIIRTILQQLETAGLVAQVDKDGRKGRVLTPKGHSLLDKAAKGVAK